jgi:hypothetical protein
MVKDWSRAIPFLLLLALLLPLLLPAPIPGIYAQTSYVDVWTNKGAKVLATLMGDGTILESRSRSTAL